MVGRGARGRRAGKTAHSRSSKRPDAGEARPCVRWRRRAGRHGDHQPLRRAGTPAPGPGAGTAASWPGGTKVGTVQELVVITSRAPARRTALRPVRRPWRSPASAARLASCARAARAAAPHREAAEHLPGHAECVASNAVTNTSPNEGQRPEQRVTNTSPSTGLSPGCTAGRGMRTWRAQGIWTLLVLRAGCHILQYCGGSCGARVPPAAVRRLPSSAGLAAGAVTARGRDRARAVCQARRAAIRVRAARNWVHAARIEGARCRRGGVDAAPRRRRDAPEI